MTANKSLIFAPSILQLNLVSNDSLRTYTHQRVSLHVQCANVDRIIQTVGLRNIANC